MITQTALKNSVFALTITMLGLLSACASQPAYVAARPPAHEAVTRRPHSLGQKAAVIAYEQVGVPYRYGGATTKGFDCSGLVHYAYRHAGNAVARTTGALWSSTTSVRREDLQVGDLLFFRIEGKMSHVGLYLGGQRFVHAPSSGRTVSVEKLTSPFYSAAFIRGGRPK